jgi:hypothetical protein
MSTAAHNPADLKAAFMGMAGGVIAVFLVCWGVMELTNIKFADHAAPGSTTAPAPATTTPPAGSDTPAASTATPAGTQPEAR